MKKLATRDSLGDVLPLLGEKYKEIVVLDCDLAKATKLDKFMKMFPARSFQIGIAEANAIGIASGLSEHGFKVFLGSFASFLTGRYDIIRCSLAYSNCPVVLVGTHCGMAIGKDGVTQMALEDVALIRALPNMKILNPATYSEAIKCITYLCETKLDGPHYLRLGRQPVEDVREDRNAPFEFGKGTIVKNNLPSKARNSITLFSTGCILPDVLRATELIETKSREKDLYPCTTRVVNFHTLKPIDKEMIIKCAKETMYLFSVEDHTVVGGFGSIISEVLTDEYPAKLTRIGLNDIFPESGDPKDLYEKYGLSAEKIAERVLGEINES